MELTQFDILPALMEDYIRLKHMRVKCSAGEVVNASGDACRPLTKM